MFGLYNSSALPMLLVIDVDSVPNFLAIEKNVSNPCTRWLIVTVSDSIAFSTHHQ